MRKIIFSIIIFSFTLYGYGQSNTGTPYSNYGLGLLPENQGPFSGMGGVGAAMRDNNNINFLNPASYTALDSNRFYFQLGINGEYVHISTRKESANYRVAQNTSFNMAFRLTKNFYASLGFSERSDIGYDLRYTNLISGDETYLYNQHIQGEGGLNDCYLGLAYQFKNLSIGVNTSYIFGKIEKRQTLETQLANAYYIKTSDNIRVSDILFDIGAQYLFKLSPKSKLTIGSTFNFGTDLNAKQTFTSYKVNSGTGSSVIIDDEKLKNGNISYPFRILGGVNYDYKNRWNIAGDYTFQKMSSYHEFGKSKKFQDYHKGALGISYTPERYGRFWWQRNRYMLGSYVTRSHIELKDHSINTYAVTLGAQMPFITRKGELMLGIAFDLGMRGTEKNGLIQEKFAKVRVNISFKEAWFMKQKIN